MNECFITRLKAVVDNDNLPLFNVLEIKASTVSYETSAQITLEIGTESECTIKALDGGYFSETLLGLENPAERLTNKTISKSDGIVTLYFLNSDYRIRVQGKSDINNILFVYSLKKSLFSLNIDELDSNFYLQQLVIARSLGTTGDLKSLSNLTELTLINAHTTSLYGDVSVLRNLIKLNYLSLEQGSGSIVGDVISLMNDLPVVDYVSVYKKTGIYGVFDNLRQNTFTFLSLEGTGVSGTVEGFVASQVQNGRTSADDIDIYGILTFATFGGNLYAATSRKHMYVSWDGTSKIIISTGKSIGTVTNSTIYAKGASSSEISTWQSRGNTVIVI